MTDPVIDLSHWNQPVDFEAMQRGGVIGVIHKATEGASVIDDTYAGRMRDAQSAGLLWGAYHFLRPGDMQAQAEFFVEQAGDIDLYAADHEDSGVLLDDLKVFLQEVEKLTGKKPIIYSGHVLKEQVKDNVIGWLKPYRLWLAQYTSAAQPDWPEQIWPMWWLWQWTESGSCPGVGGDVDCNRYAGTNTELVDEWLGDEEKPAEVVITVRITASGANVTVTRE